jgi:hypothetical protein
LALDDCHALLGKQPELLLVGLGVVEPGRISRPEQRTPMAGSVLRRVRWGSVWGSIDLALGG